MEEFTTSWSDLFIGVLIMAAIYILLIFLASFTKQSYFTGNNGEAISRRLKTAIVIFEPLAIIILLVIFILIRPALHGLAVGIILLLAYFPLRNYIDGRLFLMNNKIEKGQHLKVGEVDGILQRVGRLGIVLRTGEGTRFVNYSTLIRDGYTMLKDDTSGGFHRLSLTLAETDTPEKQYRTFENKLLDCPYLDWTYKPEFEMGNHPDEPQQLKFLLNKDKHLEYFKQWVEENGFTCNETLQNN